MLIYHYDRLTGAYTKTTEARPDPLEHKKLVDAELAVRLAKKTVDVKDLREKVLVVLTDAEKTNLPTPVKFLIPGCATVIAPSVVSQGSEAYFVNGAWATRLIAVKGEV